MNIPEKLETRQIGICVVKGVECPFGEQIMRKELIIGNPYRELINGKWHWYIDFAALQPSGRINPTFVTGGTEKEVCDKMREIADIYNEEKKK